MIEDRDKARYGFHGRQDIIREFVEILEEAVEDRDGGILIFQGPPGVGKTTLLLELSRIAKEELDWEVVDISPTVFADASQLADAAGLNTAVNEQRSSQGEAVGGIGMEQSRAFDNPSQVLRSIAQPGKGTLLVMDEAQRIDQILCMGVEQEMDATNALRLILSGRCGGPVLLLAGGLGLTENAFREMGIERLHGGSVTNLNQVSDKSARKIIEAGLSKGAKVRASSRGYTELVEEVVKRSLGWPQHLVSYGAAAVEVMREYGRRGLPPDVRKRILERGDELREEYYSRTASSLERWECAVLGHLVRHSGDKNKWDSLILKQIDNALQERNDNPLPLRERALASGVLAEVPNEKVYHIPIPLMADWLVQQAVEHSKDHFRDSQELEAAAIAALPRPAPVLADARDRGTGHSRMTSKA